MSAASQIFRTATSRFQRAAGWLAANPNSPIVSGWALVYLGLVVAVLIFAVGGIAQWREGSGQDVVAVNVLWHVVWVTYSLLKVLFLVFLALWIVRHYRNRNIR